MKGYFGAFPDYPSMRFRSFVFEDGVIRFMAETENDAWMATYMLTSLFPGKSYSLVLNQPYAGEVWRWSEEAAL